MKTPDTRHRLSTLSLICDDRLRPVADARFALEENDSSDRTLDGSAPNSDRVLQPGTPAPEFSLKNEDGFWELMFDGQRAVLPQHQGLFYLAWLLQHPGEPPISAHELAMRVHKQSSLHEDFQQEMPWIQVTEDRAAAEKFLLARQQQLEAILEDDLQFEPVKQEAMRELRQIHVHQAQTFLELSEAVRRTREIVDKMLLRLHGALTKANDPRGNPHPVQRAFAMHLLFYLFMPSILAGGYVYLPPEGVV